MMEPVRLNAWPRYLREQIDPDPSEGSPDRMEVVLRGALNIGGEPFEIGRARDALGTLLRLSPQLPTNLGSGRKDHNGLWHHLWARIATRAGYRMPGIDPEAYNTLCELKGTTARLEFIFDTTELISGTGHFLVRMFGDRADLVRTVVTDKEIQGFRDKWGSKRNIQSMDDLQARTNFLGASRFLESVPHRHPIWRSLDVGDEALLAASGSNKKDGGKSPAADTMVLRAARRSIQDQVPGLRRFFVTGDAGLARAAAHMLPAGSTIATWITRLDPEGEILAPLHWWPRGGPHGAGVMTQLAELIREALCICAEIRVLAGENEITVRGFRPDHNEYPSLWREPILWVERVQSSVLRSSNVVYDGAMVEAGRSTVAGATDSSHGSGEFLHRQALLGWPLREPDTSARHPTGARFSRTDFLDAVTQVMQIVRSGQGRLEHPFKPEADKNREFYHLLEAAELIDADHRPTALAESLPNIFAGDDLDALTAIFARLEPFGMVLDELRRSRSLRIPVDTIASPKGKKLQAYLALARVLGQALEHADTGERRLWYGGGSPDRTRFESWLERVVHEESAMEPLREAPMKRIALRALDELRISPARLQRALKAVLDGPMGRWMQGNQGGSDDREFLAGTVVELHADGYHLVTLGGDGLCGLRSLAWRSK
jgi:hypothetical protein